MKDNLHIHARNTSEQQLISDLKRLALQDEVDLSDLVFEGILLMFNAHHWPPGNPQLQLTSFQKEQTPPSTMSDNLCTCGRPVERAYRLWQDKTLYKSCKVCFNKIYSSKIQGYAIIDRK